MTVSVRDSVLIRLKYLFPRSFVIIRRADALEIFARAAIFRWESVGRRINICRTFFLATGVQTVRGRPDLRLSVISPVSLYLFKVREMKDLENFADPRVLKMVFCFAPVRNNSITTDLLRSSWILVDISITIT